MRRLSPFLSWSIVPVFSQRWLAEQKDDTRQGRVVCDFWTLRDIEFFVISYMALGYSRWQRRCFLHPTLATTQNYRISLQMALSFSTHSIPSSPLQYRPQNPFMETLKFAKRMEYVLNPNCGLATNNLVNCKGVSFLGGFHFWCILVTKNKMYTTITQSGCCQDKKKCRQEGCNEDASREFACLDTIHINWRREKLKGLCTISLSSSPSWRKGH